MPVITKTIPLGEDLLETDYPLTLLDPVAYTWDDTVALNPSEYNDRAGIAFAAVLAGAVGTLVTIVVHPPSQFGFIDKRARDGVPASSQGTEVMLGTGSGTVRLREHIAGGRPQALRSDSTVRWWVRPSVPPRGPGSPWAPFWLRQKKEDPPANR